MKKKIAFFRTWSSPPIGTSVAQVLHDSFPQYDIDVIDIVNLIKQNPGIVFVNLLHVTKDYGLDIFRGNKSLKESFWRTPYIFKWIKTFASKRLKNGNYAFSFQLQSIFDASNGILPHFIYTDHTHFANLYYSGFSKHNLYSKSWINLEISAYKNATMIFTRSNNVSQSVRDHYGCATNKVVCVYAGSNAKITNYETEKNNYINKNILFVGMDWERKGGPQLIEAFNRVIKEQPDATLTIVGCSPGIKSPNCHIIGQVPIDTIHQYYEQASVFCMPTLREPFGIAFVEALSYKLPIVTTNIGAIPDFVVNGYNGYMLLPHDIDGLVEVLNDLLSSPAKCRILGENSFKIAKSKYTWENVGALLQQNILPIVEK